MRASGRPKGGIRVFIIDGHPLVREGVRSFLANHGIVVVGEAADAKQALRKVAAAAPDVVILEVSLPRIDGGELARRLRRLIPAAKLIAFSMHAGEAYVVKMARCGVRGYLTKDRPPLELVDAIRSVHAGGLEFPPGLGDVLLSSKAVSPAAKHAAAELTDREVEVLSLLADGFSNKGIASKLGISSRTAETHRENISRKLDILTIAGLTKYALKKGLTSFGAPGAGRSP